MRFISKSTQDFESLITYRKAGGKEFQLEIDDSLGLTEEHMKFFDVQGFKPTSIKFNSLAIDTVLVPSKWEEILNNLNLIVDFQKKSDIDELIVVFQVSTNFSTIKALGVKDQIVGKILRICESYPSLTIGIETSSDRTFAAVGIVSAARNEDCKNIGIVVDTGSYVADYNKNKFMELLGAKEGVVYPSLPEFLELTNSMTVLYNLSVCKHFGYTKHKGFTHTNNQQLLDFLSFFAKLENQPQVVINTDTVDEFINSRRIIKEISEDNAFISHKRAAARVEVSLNANLVVGTYGLTFPVKIVDVSSEGIGIIVKDFILDDNATYIVKTENIAVKCKKAWQEKSMAGLKIIEDDSFAVAALFGSIISKEV